ncbi:MAG: polysaccharide biosynthesis protein [Planctomycetes bacterium]|nr:polysaccharide biosynthesis protein [Planctomycetota bacterium]
MKSTWHKSLNFRRPALFVSDMVIILCAYYLAYWLRLDLIRGDQAAYDAYLDTFWYTIPWLLVIRFLCSILMRQYTWAFRLASLPEAANLVKAAIIGSVLFFLRWHLSADLLQKPPLSVYVIEFALSLMGMAFVRFFPRYFYQQYFHSGRGFMADGESRLRTLIFGAGSTGDLILRDLQRTKIYPYRVIGLIDDNPAKRNISIHGCRVLGSSDDLPRLIRKHKIEKILIAAPEMTGSRLRRILDICSNHHVQYKIVPNYAELVSKGDTAPITLKDLQPEDLLDRLPVEFDHTRMAALFHDRTLLVTGAAGSIGSEICRQVVGQGIKKLVAVDINENNLYFLKLEINELAPGLDLSIEVASVRDRQKIQELFARHQPHIVYHAAAHKHVPLIENCPEEALKNNVLGTLYVAEAADQNDVERFVLISTDKAVGPSSVMGASKRLAEDVVRDMDLRSKTRFMVVRFGNVLGSSGSLVPILQRQISKGGPVTITHPKITRFFMTIQEAVGLVIVASAQDEGNLCVLDMGEQLNVDRLARQMITLSGFIPDQDIPIIYTGLRPGEKMFEELFTKNEQRRSSSHARIFLADGDAPRTTIPEMLKALEVTIESGRRAAVFDFLHQHVKDYQPVENSPEKPKSDD